MNKKENKKELMKFDPPIKSRFLPGEIDSSLAKLDLKSYESHRLYCANMKSLIDNRPPRLEVDTYYNRQKLNEDARKAKMNYNDNLDLAIKMNTFFRMGGKVDCWNFKEKKYKTDQLEKKAAYKQIMKENQALFDKVNSLTSEYSPQAMAKQWKSLKEQIESKSRYPWFNSEITKYPSITVNAILPSNSKPIRRLRCFFDLELAHSNLPLGRIVFELYTDYVPLTCANFEAFCKGIHGLSYKGTPFHRILSDYWCQGGDVTKFNGIGEASIYEDVIPDENYTLRHTCPGVLSTFSEEGSVCDSKFNLTFRPLETMDGRKVVFGKVIKGIQNLLKIEAYGTKFGKPLEKVIVSNCGVLQLRKRQSKRLSNQSKASKEETKVDK